MFMQRLGASPFENRFRETFSKIRSGQSEVEVLEHLGAPDERSRELHLGQRRGNEAAYARAARSGCVEYLLWRKGSDVVYAVGVDAVRKVCFVGSGGT
jgi:hypothetical protein